LLLPIAGVVERFDVESFTQFFYQGIDHFFLVISSLFGFAVGYDAEAYGLACALPGLARYGGELLLPLSGWLNFAVVAAEAVTDNEVAV